MIDVRLRARLSRHLQSYPFHASYDLVLPGSNVAQYVNIEPHWIQTRYVKDDGNELALGRTHMLITIFIVLFESQTLNKAPDIYTQTCPQAFYITLIQY